MPALTSVQTNAIMVELQSNAQLTLTILRGAIDKGVTKNSHLHFDLDNGRYRLSRQSGFHTLVGIYSYNWPEFWKDLHKIPIPENLDNTYVPDNQTVTTAASTSASTSAPGTTSTSGPTSSST